MEWIVFRAAFFWMLSGMDIVKLIDNVPTATKEP